jgi:predicted XRE-type DNA-binding protein|tara:strand:- start:305 stop:607 length:303 start_codon:yes stop_codon:yes gene_type:complete
MTKSVFEELGLQDSKALEAKGMLAAEILKTIRQRGLTQKEAATLAGSTQSKISRICRAELDGFSTEKLIQVLTGLGRDVTVEVGKRVNKTRPGQLTVAAA